MFSGSNLLSNGASSSSSSSPAAASTAQQPPQQEQQQYKPQQQTQQQGQHPERHNFLAEQTNSEIWGCPLFAGLPFLEDPFFSTVLPPFRALDGFLCGSGSNNSCCSSSSMSQHPMAADQQRQQRWSHWNSSSTGGGGGSCCSNSNSNSSSIWPAYFYSDFFHPELFFAPAPSPLFRKPWWRPSYWVQQRQLDQQRQQQQQQRQEEEEQQQQQWRQQQQQLGGCVSPPLFANSRGIYASPSASSSASSCSSASSSAPSASVEDEIPVLLSKNKCDSVGFRSAVPSGAASSRDLLHPAYDPTSAEAAEERALQMRRMKWLIDPFLSDPLSLYLPLSWETFLQEDTNPAAAASAPRSATTPTAASAAAAAPAGTAAATAAARPPATSSSTVPSRPPTTTPLISFASPSAAAAVPSAAAARPAAAASASLPRIDIRDCGDVLLVDAEVPGFKKENLHVCIEGRGLLRISGEQQQPPPHHQQQEKSTRPGQQNSSSEGYYYLQERLGSSSFCRAIPLPGNVKENGIHASMSDGVLHLRIPKEEPPAVKPSRVIAIE